MSGVLAWLKRWGISIWSLVADPQTLVDQISDLLSAAPDEVRTFFEQQLSSLAGASSSGLAVSAGIGVLAAIWTTSSAMSHLVSAINLAYGEEDTRGFVKKRSLALALTGGAIIFGLVIIGLLAALAIPNMARMQNRAREAVVRQNMHLVQTAVEDFAVLSTGRYPDNGTDVSDDGRTVRELCPGAVYPGNPYSNAATPVVWDADPSGANPGEIGLNPATPSSYVIKGAGAFGVMSVQLTTGS